MQTRGRCECARTTGRARTAESRQIDALAAARTRSYFRRMTTRRQFLIGAPVGVAGALSLARVAGASSIGSPRLPSPSPRPMLRSVPPDAPVLHWIPRHDELAYSFGGVAPRQHITSGT